MHRILLYHIPKKIWTTLIDETAPNWNLPMYQNTIILYKNSSQTIEIDVCNIDRKPITIFNAKIVVNILNGTELILSRECKIPRTARNKAIFELKPSDTMYWQDGYYSYSVHMETDTGEKNLLVLDQAMGSVGVIELRNGAFPSIKDTIYFEKFNTLSIGSVLDPTPITKTYFITDFYRQPKETMILYTAVAYCTNFSGKLWVQACIQNHVPGTDFEWFDMNIEHSDSICLREYTGIHVFNFEANVRYIRFRYLPDREVVLATGLDCSGSIDKILLRD